MAVIEFRRVGTVDVEDTAEPVPHVPDHSVDQGVRVAGEPPQPGADPLPPKAFRAVAVAVVGLGLLRILVSDDRRGLHDKIAGTLVVRDAEHSLAPWAVNHIPGEPG